MESQLTILAAWWGALVATLVLLWDIFKWETAGPRLRLTVRANYMTVNIPESEGGTFVMVTVDNIGDSATTITGLGFVYFKNHFNRYREKYDGKGMAVVRPSPGDSQPLPYIIQPGGQWLGMADQTEGIKKKSQEGHLICRISHSFSERPVERRLVIKS